MILFCRREKTQLPPFCMTAGEAFQNGGMPNIAVRENIGLESIRHADMIADRRGAAGRTPSNGLDLD